VKSVVGAYWGSKLVGVRGGVEMVGGGGEVEVRGAGVRGCPKEVGGWGGGS